MLIKGDFIGCNLFESKKGTKCFFGSIETEYDTKRCPNAIGLNTVQIAAFGQEAQNLYDTIMQYDLEGKTVELSGLYQGNTFMAISINEI